MKVYRSAALSLLLGTSLWGQANPNQAPTQQTNQAALSAGQQNRPPLPADANANRMQLNQQLAIELQQMRVKLDAMKANDASVKDPAVRKHLQLDAELWDLMFAHMSQVTSALLQRRATPPSLSPAAQLYRRQLMQDRMSAPATMPLPPQSVPAQPTAQPAAPQATPPSHP